MSGCPPDLAIERYHLGEIAGTASAVWVAHIEGCEACRAALDALAQDDAAFAASRGDVGLAKAGPPPHRAPTPLWRRRALATAIALAASIAAFLVWRPLPPDTVQLKGAGVLGVTLDGQPWAGAPLAVGAQIQLTWSGAARGYLAVIALERDGTTAVLHPADGARAVEVPAARDLALGDGLVVQPSNDGARVCALFAPQPFKIGRAQTDACRDDHATATVELRVRP